MGEAVTPGLQAVFSLRLRQGDPILVGSVATGGVRRLIPVIGGTLQAQDWRAEIIPASSSELQLERPDGVIVTEYSCLLGSEAGEVLRLTASGYVTAAPNYEGTRMTLMFETQESAALAWLSTRVFVAERPAGAEVFDIALVT